MSARPTMHRWADLPIDAPMALLERRRVMGDKAMISHITLYEGFEIESHTHENEQFSAVLSGWIRFGVGAPGSPEHTTIDVRAGEVIHLPSNCPHSARAMQDTVVLDIFSPPCAHTGIDQKR